MPGGPWAGPSPASITRPPPPYPSQSSAAQSVSQNTYAHPRFSAPQMQNMAIRGYRPGECRQFACAGVCYFVFLTDDIAVG